VYSPGGYPGGYQPGWVSEGLSARVGNSGVYARVGNSGVYARVGIPGVYHGGYPRCVPRWVSLRCTTVGYVHLLLPGGYVHLLLPGSICRLSCYPGGICRLSCYPGGYVPPATRVGVPPTTRVVSLPFSPGGTSSHTIPGYISQVHTLGYTLAHHPSVRGSARHRLTRPWRCEDSLGSNPEKPVGERG